MISTEVFFTPINSCLGVRPPIESGRRNSVWVMTRTDNTKEIEETAKRKMRLGFGVEIKDLDLCNQFGE